MDALIHRPFVWLLLFLPWFVYVTRSDFTGLLCG
jgi:hypothetical protein